MNNRIALNQRLATIRSTAVPLHNRKAKANSDSQNFNAVLAQKVKKTDTVTLPQSNASLQVDLSHIYTPSVTQTAIKEQNNNSSEFMSTDEIRQKFNFNLVEMNTHTKGRLANLEGTVQIPIGRNELYAFMEEIQRTLANGEPLVNALEKQIAKHTYIRECGNWGTSGNAEVDLIRIDLKTGEVHDVSAKSRAGTQEILDADAAAVQDLANDLATFLRYTAFREAGDCLDEIDKILAEIKARQADKCYARFDCFSNIVNEEIEDEEIEEIVESEDLIDQFIETIAKHQETQNAEPNKTATAPTYSLTTEQIEYLKGKYDFNGMTSIPKELLNDLADMNVISREEADRSYIMPEYEGGQTEYKNNNDILWKMSDSISRLQARLDFSARMIADKSVDEETKAVHLERMNFLGGIIESRNKLLDLLSELMRD